jgi:hypothetical protein
MAGGPFVVYDRVVDNRRVLTFDANSLYGWCLSQELPVGRRLYSFDRDKGYRILGGRQTSMAERAWIDLLRREGRVIHTAEETPTNRIVVQGASGAKYQPDGVNRRERIVYEFLGDYWHGSTEKRHKATEEKMEDMRRAGWSVVTMWEGEFKRAHPGVREDFEKRTLPEYVYRFIRTPGKSKDIIESLLQVDRVTRDILSGTLYGFAEVDIECTDPGLFPALFYKKDGVPRNSHSAEGVLLHTPYLATLLRRGYVIKHVQRVWVFSCGNPFKPFVDWAVEERKKGNPTAKLLVNSLYGGTILNKRNYVRTRCTENDVKRGAMVMEDSFRDMHWIKGAAVHIFSTQTSVRMDTPSHVGKAVLTWLR